MVNPRALARYLALGRALLGAALLVAPGRLAVPWVGSDGSRAAARTIARGLGARDLAIAADTGDLLATLAAGDAIPARGRALVGAMAFGGAALGGVSLAGILRQRQSPS